MEKRINVGGININIWKQGSGKPVFLLPGWNGTFSDYRDLLGAISRQSFTAYAIEFPGTGKSDAPPGDWMFSDFISLVDKVFNYYGIDKAVILGHSLGCVAALQFAGRFSERVEKLVLVNSPVLSKRGHRWIFGKIFDIGFLTVAILFGLAARTARLFKIIAKTLLLYKIWKVFISFDTQLVIDWLDKQYYFLTHSDGVMRKILRVVIESDTKNDARYVRAPTLIVWGERSGITPLRNSKALRENIPDNSFILIPNGRHQLHGETAEQFAVRMGEWLSRGTTRSNNQ